MRQAADRDRTGTFLWDLFAVAFAAGITILLALRPDVGNVLAYLRVPLGFLFVFFLPGYAITTVLFPGSGDAAVHPDNHTEVNAVERLVLSVGLSIAVVPLAGLFWNFTPWGIGLMQVIGSVAGITIVAAAVASYRRWQVPPMQRFEPSLSASIERVLRVHRTSPRRGRLLNIAIALLLVSSAAGIAVGITFPGEGERYTEFYLLSENPETGNLTASGYPTEFDLGDQKPIVIGVENNEHRTVNYTVVIRLQQLNRGSATIVSRSSELDRFGLVLAEGETFQQRRSLDPNMVGQDLRLVFLIYKGSPPAEPSVQNAYRHAHLWIDVQSEQ